MSSDRIARAADEMLNAFDADEGLLGANYVRDDGGGASAVVLDGQWDLRKVARALDDAGLFAPTARLRAFATECVEHGDMTPAAARMLNRILDGE